MGQTCGVMCAEVAVKQFRDGVEFLKARLGGVRHLGASHLLARHNGENQIRPKAKRVRERRPRFNQPSPEDELILPWKSIILLKRPERALW
jgi:hypothetical protein